jgi:hypothetical protein
VLEYQAAAPNFSTMVWSLSQLVVIIGIAFGWPHHALAHDVRSEPEDIGKLMSGLAIDNLRNEALARAIEARATQIRVDGVDELASVFENERDLAQAESKAPKGKKKTRAHRNMRRKAPTATEIDPETKRRLYELQLLDALRSAR